MLRQRIAVMVLSLALPAIAGAQQVKIYGAKRIQLGDYVIQLDGTQVVTIDGTQVKIGDPDDGGDDGGGSGGDAPKSLGIEGLARDRVSEMPDAERKAVAEAIRAIPKKKGLTRDRIMPDTQLVIYDAVGNSSERGSAWMDALDPVDDRILQLEADGVIQWKEGFDRAWLEMAAGIDPGG